MSWPSWRRLDEFWFWQREEKLVEMEWIVGQVGGSPGWGPVVVGVGGWAGVGGLAFAKWDSTMEVTELMLASKRWIVEVVWSVF